jgi:hypothetical protein
VNLASWWTNYGSGDFSIPTSSPLKDAGGSGCAGLTDYVGTSRPQGTACDAGAFELASGSGGGGPVQGDLNSDTHVNITDLSILLSHYGQSATQAQGDINNDGTCSITDLSILLSHYGV